MKLFLVILVIFAVAAAVLGGRVEPCKEEKTDELCKECCESAGFDNDLSGMATGKYRGKGPGGKPMFNYYCSCNSKREY